MTPETPIFLAVCDVVGVEAARVPLSYNKR